MDHSSYFRDLYRAFNRRDADGVLAMMSDDVNWPNAWQGGRLSGRKAVGDYWAAQWAEIDPRVEPISIAERADGAVAVTVHQIVHSLDGHVLSDQEILHVYRLDDGLVRRMDVETLEQ